MAQAPSRSGALTRGSVAALALHALVALLVVATFYPGVLSPDTTDQLRQATTGEYTSWHPPLLALTWRVLNHVVYGPASMFLWNIALVFVGLALVTRNIESVWLRGAIMTLVPLAPPILVLLRFLTKDVTFAGYMLVGAGLVLHPFSHSTGARRISLFAGIFVCGLAAGTRHDGILATLPIALAAGYRVASTSSSAATVRARAVATCGAAVAILVLVVAIDVLANRMARPVRREYPEQVMLVHDLVAVSRASNRMYLPEWVTAPQHLDMDWVRDRYSTDIADQTAWGGPTGRWFPFTEDAEQMAILRRAWFRAVREHPKAYLRHRLALFETLVGWDRIPWGYYQRDVDASVANRGLLEQRAISAQCSVRQCDFHSSPWKRRIARAFDPLADSVVFRGWVYFVACIGAFVAAILLCRRIDPSVSLALSSSGVCHSFAFFLAGPGYVPRYLLWMTFCALIATASLLQAVPWFARPRTS